jgi:hypothetical protein
VADVAAADGGSVAAAKRLREGEAAVIVRIWRGWSSPENADAYQRIVGEEVLPSIAARNMDGYRGAYLLRRNLDREVEFATIMLFDRDLRATRPRAGRLLAASGSPNHRRSIVPVDRGPTDSQGRSDRCHAVLPGPIHSRATSSLCPVSTDGRPPWRPRARAAASPAGGAFADEVAFEFGQGGEHVEHQLAAGGGGVNRFLEARNPTPRSARPVTVSTRCRSDLPSRSSFQTTRVSPARSRAST